MYSEQTLFGELLKNKAVKDFIEKNVPELMDKQAMDFMKDVSVEGLLAIMSGNKKEIFRMLIDIANGKNVDFASIDSKNSLPEIDTDGAFVYDIDDVDGSAYLMEHRFSGCLTVRFSKNMDESVYGEVTYNGKKLPDGLIKKLDIIGGIQMCGIPVRDILKEYDKDYQLVVKGFRDTDGNEMKTQTITVHTLPEKVPDPAYEEHDHVALQAAEEGIVLLKNKDNILPLVPDTVICLKNAELFRITAVGAGRINPRYSVALKCAVEKYSHFIVSEDADTVIYVVSRPSGENFDNNAVKGEFYLSDEEETTLHALGKKGKKIVAVINSGYPMDLRWTEHDYIKAVLWCGFPGMLGGKAVAEILDGRVNPSGKLPDTWALDYWDIPASRNFYQPSSPDMALGSGCKLFIDTCYEEDIYVGYRYFETFGIETAYPFGFGLSYTTFSMDTNMQVEDDTAHFFVKVTNTGKRAGKEVVQIYAQIPDGRLEQPSKRLVGFHKTKELQPGESQELKITVSKKNLDSFDTETASWIMEAGEYCFYVGNSVKNLKLSGKIHIEETKFLKKSENLMKLPVEMKTLSKKERKMPEGKHSGIKKGVSSIEPAADRKHYPAVHIPEDALAAQMTVEELARLSVCASYGWGMHEKGEAGKLFQIAKYNLPEFLVADGNNGVNIKKLNIGMPSSNIVCATWNAEIAYEIGRVIAEEAKENNIHMILAPAMNIHRNPLNGRHPEYFSEDPYLAGIMAGNHSKGLEDHGVSSCMKHAVANNCEASRKRNQSLATERALREIYLKVFEVAMSVNLPDSMMTAYNAVNGCFTAEDEEMIQGIFRGEFGFKGFVMTDWESYDSIDIAAVQAGNCWITPGSKDRTYVDPIIEGVKDGRIDEARLRENVHYMLQIMEKKTK